MNKHQKQYFKSQRKKHGLSQSQMAKILGKTPKYLSKLENGHNQPNLEIVLSYYLLFGIDIKKLIPDHYYKLQNSLANTLEKQPYLMPNKTISEGIRNRLNISHLKDKSNLMEYADR
ncbi:MAG: helix-turn-helix transcriptional regulator [Arenicella sp.]